MNDGIQGVTGTPAAAARESVGRHVRRAVVFLLLPFATLPAQDEGPLEPLFVVRGLAFHGNASIDDQVLRNAIATSRSSWFQRSGALRWLPLGEKRYFNETEFRRDVLRVRAFYRQSGYPEARVDTVVTRLSPSDVWLRFEIVEGEPVIVTELHIDGLNGVVRRGEALDRMPLQRGRPFDRLRLRASADTLRAMFAARGHPFADVFTNFDENRTTREARVHFVVDPGQRSRIGTIDVVGARAVPPDVVRQRLTVQPGRIYSERDVYASQVELFRSNLYSSVNLRLLDSVPPADSLVTLQVRVSETPLHRLRLGAGYGTTDCFRMLGQWSVNDFLGGGRQLLLNARMSRIGVGGAAALESRIVCGALGNDLPELLTLNYNLSASLHQPYFIWRRTSATLSVFGERQSEFLAYRRDAIGGDGSITRHLGTAASLTLSQAFIRGSTITDPAKLCVFLNVCAIEDTVFSEPRFTSRTSLSLTRDTRNSLFDPTRGSAFRTEVAFAGKALGSDSLSQFLKGSIDYAQYLRVARGHTFAWRVYVGAQVTPSLTFAGGSGRLAPPEERFYAGGATTVRGFAQNELGPVVHVLEGIRTDTVTQAVDSIVRTSPIGGNGVVVANAEYRFALSGGGKLVGALFLDAGQVFENGEDLIGLSGIRLTPGVGLRIASPLGPVRLDLAYRPYGNTRGRLFRPVGNVLERVPLPGDGLYAPPVSAGIFSHLRLHFSIGQAF